MTAILSGVSKAKRPDALSLDYLTAFTFGPKNIGDSTAGPYDRAWRVRATVAGVVYLSRANDTNTAWLPEVPIFGYSGAAIDEVDIAFEQAAQPVIVAQRGGEVWIYRFDPIVSAFTFTSFGVGRNPRCALDSPLDVSTSDVLVFYMNDTTGFLSYRVQRERYATEYSSGLAVNTDYFLEEVAFSRDNRIQLWYSKRDEATGKYVKEQLQTLLYPYITEADRISAAVQVDSGVLLSVIAVLALAVESLQPASTPISGSLGLLVRLLSLYDIEELQAGSSIASGILASIVILHTLYDVEQLRAASTISSGTLVVAVIQYLLYDYDSLKVGTTISSGILA